MPTVAAYRFAWEGCVIRMMVALSTPCILANLVLGENVVPEFLQGDCTPDRLAARSFPLLGDTPERRRQLEAFARLDAIMDLSGEPPSARARARRSGPDRAKVPDIPRRFMLTRTAQWSRPWPKPA